MSAKKYYVVWEGADTGVFDSWDDVEPLVTGFPGAKYKSFTNRDKAVEAFRSDPSQNDMSLLQAIIEHQPRVNYDAIPEINQDAIAVDAACAGNPGPVEYRGVLVRTGEEIFRVGPLDDGTNNIGEFLALIHALALCEKQGRTGVTIYSDSRTAQAWVRNRHAKTSLAPTPRNAPLRQILARAEAWIQTHTPLNPVLKWNTEEWGEIPADFGRK